MTCMRCTTPKACDNMGCMPGAIDPYQALLSDLEDWVERLEDALDGRAPVEADRVLDAMRATLAAAGRERS